MSGNSKIEWTDATWNPVRGCTRVSPGCGGPGDQGGCYAERMAARFSKPGMWGHGYAEMRDGKPRWTGKVNLIHENLITPLRWRKSRKIFANSTSDLFHEALSDDDIACVYAYMAGAYWHTFQILTKRPSRAQKLLSSDKFRETVDCYLLVLDTEAGELGLYDPLERRTDDWRAQCPDVIETWPLPNIWHGTSAERQQEADERIPLLLETPAAVRFVSAEPLLGLVRFHERLGDDWLASGKSGERRGLDWVIVGGESGPNARPCHPDWVRSIRHQCQAAGVPFFFKQWGEWAPGECAEFPATRTERVAHYFGSEWNYSKLTPRVSAETHIDDEPDVYRIGKSRAGRLLDGREWNEFPP